MKQTLFLDNAGTTRVHDSVIHKMLQVAQEGVICGNDDIRKAKARLGHWVHKRDTDIVFTASGTIANHLAIETLVDLNKHKGRHVLVSAIEHPSVLNTCLALKEKGFDVQVVYPLASGIVPLEAFVQSIRKDTILVSLMYYNNETGVKQPVEALGTFLKAKGIAFHVDAVQALGKTVIDVACTSMSFSAHKIHGPKGCGALYIQGGQVSNPMLISHDVVAIAGFDAAIEETYMAFETAVTRLYALKARLIDGLKGLHKGIEIIGEQHHAHPCIVNVNFSHRDGDGLVIQYDWEGIAVSSGSACSSGAMSASPVLLAMGFTEEKAKKSVRFSLSVYTTEQDIDYVLRVTERIMNQ